MAVRELKYYGANVLRRPTKPINYIDNQIVRLGLDLIESMYHYNGVGLAGPQIGISKRICVVDAGKEYQEEPIVLINPVVTKIGGSQTGNEGCLSLPELFLPVTRPKYVTIKAINLKGEDFYVEAEDLLARALLHEIDHLNEKLFIDYVEDKSLLEEEIPKLKERINKILKGERYEVQTIENKN